MANDPFGLGYDPYNPTGTAPASEPVLPIVPPAPDMGVWPAAQPAPASDAPGIPATPTAADVGEGASAAAKGAQTLFIPVDHDPFTVDPFAAAAERLRRGAQSERKEGLLTKAMEQNWVIRGIQSGLTLPRDILEGRVMANPGLRREDITDIPPPSEPTKDSTWLGRLMGVAPVAAEPQDELIERTLDMANLAMTGGMLGSVRPDLKGFRVFGKTPDELGRMASDYANGRVSAEQFLQTADQFSKINPFQYEVLKDVSGYSAEQLRAMTPAQVQQAYSDFVNSPAWGNELRKSSGGATPETQQTTGATRVQGTDAQPGPIPEGQSLVPGGRGGGGPAGAGGVVEAAATAARARGNAYTPEGLPTRPLKIEGEYFVPGPVEKAQQLAQSYAQRAGITDYAPPRQYVKVDPDRAARIAQAYEEMPHAPDDPRVKASYDAMIRETVAQMDELLKAGLKIEFIKPDQADPYAASPRLAHKDVTENNHLWVFPTETGFGAADGAATAGASHPMMAPTKFEIGGHKLLANDVFRVVHDYFGHFKDGNGFRADGEEHAWRSHSAMYSPEARPAMTTETRGQNSWLNYGPYGEKNRTAKSADTVYADQKVGLLPDWVMEDGRLDPAPSANSQNNANSGSTLFSNRRQVLPSVSQQRNAAMLGTLGKPTKGKATLSAEDKLNPAYQAILPERVQRLAGEIPGLKAVLKYTTPEEAAKLRTDTAQKLVTLFNELPKAEEMAAVAHAGRAKKGWYRQSAQALLDIFGADDAPRFAALLAALSPQTSVEANAFNALKTWTNWVAAGRPTDKVELELILGRSVQGSGGADSVLDAWKNNSFRALTAADPTEIKLSGPKVNSFMLNLRDNVNEVTNDAWMANFANIDQNVFKGTGGKADADVYGQVLGKGPGYTAMSAAVRRAADIATKKTGHPWTPAEIQETVWSWAKQLYEKSSERGMTTMELLKAGGLTHEQIADTPDFGRLFVSNIYRKILEEGGYGKEIEAAAARSEAGRDGGGGGNDAGAGSRGDARSAEGSGFAQDAFERHLQRAAKRLEALRNERAAGRAKPVDKEAVAEDLAERFEERAAKLEDNGLSRAEAEAQARQEVYGDTVYIDGVETKPIDHNPFDPNDPGPMRGDVDFFSNRRPVIFDIARRQRAEKQGFTTPAFHGTRAEADFDAFKRKQNDIGVHFGTAGQANDRLDYTRRINEANGREVADGDRLYPVMLKLKNPLRMTDQGQWGKETMAYALQRMPEFADVESQRAIQKVHGMRSEAGGLAELRELIKRKGYDGIVYKNTGEVEGGDVTSKAMQEAYEALAAARKAVSPAQRADPLYDERAMPEYQAYSKAYDADHKFRNDNAEDSFIVFDPRDQVRSVHAEFNPVRNPNANLLYSNRRQVLPSLSQERKPTFYSGLEGAVIDAKIKSAPASQWLGTLKNMPGVKPEEIQWLGLEDWLKEQKGSVSKDDIAAYVAANKLDLQETVKAEGGHINPDSKYAGTVFERVLRDSMPESYNDARMILQHDGDAYFAAKNDPDLVAAMARDENWASIVAKDLYRPNEGGATQFASYQMPGEAENYREILLRLPYKGRRFGVFDGDKQILPGDFDTASEARAVARAAGHEGRATIREIGEAQEPFIERNHYHEPNVVAHTRVNDRTLPRALTQAEQDAKWQIAQAFPEIDRLRDAQHDVMRQISERAKPLRAAEGAELIRKLRAREITAGDYNRALENPADLPELVPLQNELARLREQEDALRRSLPQDPGSPKAKTLFVEEIQSDWHQQGRNKGYTSPQQVKEASDYINSLDQRAKALWDERAKQAGMGSEESENLYRATVGRYPSQKAGYLGESEKYERAVLQRDASVPDAPFKKSWPELVLKRLIREAAEKGYDQIAWTPGEVQNKRWSLDQHVDEISYSKLDDGTYDVAAFNNRGEIAFSKERMTYDQVRETLGAEMAEKLKANEGKTRHVMEGDPSSGTEYVLKGADLKVPGKGMIGFYDKILVDAANKIGKGYGAKVTTGDVPGGKTNLTSAGGMSGSTAMDIMYGDPRYASMPSSNDPDGRTMWFRELEYEAREQLFKDARDKDKKQDPQKVWVLPITPELRDAAVGKGFSLFLKGVPVVRVDHDPFEDERAQ